MLPTFDPALLGRDSLAFLPELLLCGGIVVLLLLRLVPLLDRVHLGWAALLLAGTALGFSFCQWHGLLTDYGLPHLEDAPGITRIFGGLLLYDRLTVFLRLFLIGCAILIVALSLLTGIPDREDSADFYVLLFGATLGMCLMASAGHLLMVFLSIEMASVPSYALAGFLKGRRQSSEAALKYVVYGGGASGVMLYGISLLAGTFGTGYLPDVAVALAQGLATGPQPVILLGTLFLFIGFAFKLAAVPFHFWCPDVFEGASAEVAGFLSVASKGAAVALVVRVTLLLTGLDPLSGTGVSPDVVHFLLPVLAVTAAVTTTFGNLAAYRQTNLKRLLAYSTIAHAGYMLMGLTVLNAQGVAAVLFYLGAYLFMNLGAFAVVAFLRNLTGSEDLSDCRGLVRRAPWLVCILAFCLLSLLGVPPLVGFVAKFQIFSALYQTGHTYADRGETGLAAILYGLLLLGGLNTVFSAVYYLKVLKVMIIHERVEDFEGLEARVLPEPPLAVMYGLLMALLLLALGVVFDPLTQASRAGAGRYAERHPVSKAVTQAEEKW